MHACSEAHLRGVWLCTHRVGEALSEQCCECMEVQSLCTPTVVGEEVAQDAHLRLCCLCHALGVRVLLVCPLLPQPTQAQPIKCGLH